jgi:AP-1 complex subunit gamma-1
VLHLQYYFLTVSTTFI